MKLTFQEYQGIVDSRLVNLEDALKNYKDQVAIVSDGAAEVLVDGIIKSAEKLKEAHQALCEAIEQEQINEAEEEYNKTFKEEK